MAPTVIAYNEVYNAIQNNVIAAGENEAAGVESMKFYEVAPHLAMTEHAITIRPICFSAKTFKTCRRICRRDPQGRQGSGRLRPPVESSKTAAKLDALEKAGKLKRVPFADRDAMKKLVDPVMAAYAKEIGADKIFARSTHQVSTSRDRGRAASRPRFLRSGLHDRLHDSRRRSAWRR
jgi:TRAP-type C4-dicarboxylate transport system substrate-binding protein